MKIGPGGSPTFRSLGMVEHLAKGLRESDF